MVRGSIELHLGWQVQVSHNRARVWGRVVGLVKRKKSKSCAKQLYWHVWLVGEDGVVIEVGNSCVHASKFGVAKEGDEKLFSEFLEGLKGEYQIAH